MSKREQLAKAGFEAAQQLRPEGHRETWDGTTQMVRDAYFACLDAHLAGLREPDDKMLARGQLARSCHYHLQRPRTRLGANCAQWQAMIDAIE